MSGRGERMRASGPVEVLFGAIPRGSPRLIVDCPTLGLIPYTRHQSPAVGTNRNNQLFPPNAKRAGYERRSRVVIEEIDKDEITLLRNQWVHQADRTARSHATAWSRPSLSAAP